MTKINYIRPRNSEFISKIITNKFVLVIFHANLEQSYENSGECC